jgi:hypothetical protein
MTLGSGIKLFSAPEATNNRERVSAIVARLTR